MFTALPFSLVAPVHVLQVRFLPHLSVAVVYVAFSVLFFCLFLFSVFPFLVAGILSSLTPVPCRPPSCFIFTLCSLLL